MTKGTRDNTNDTYTPAASSGTDVPQNTTVRSEEITRSLLLAHAQRTHLPKTAYTHMLPLIAKIDRRMQSSGPLVVVIDGGSASGKTTSADLLSSIYGCTVFHMDDFFLRPEQRTPERYAEPGGNVDRERFLDEVLTPLRAGHPIRYRRFDCGTMTLQPAQTFAPSRLTVIEGAYSLHPALRSDGQLSVFMKIDPDLQRTRILARNGADGARQFYTRWIPLEQHYFDAFRPEQNCDLVLPITE